MVRSSCSVRSSTRLGAEGGLGGVVLRGRELLRVALGVGGQPGQLGATDDLEEEVLVVAGGVGIAGALDGVAEVLRRHGRAIAVGEIRPQVEGDLRRVVVVVPRLRRAGDRLLVGVEPGEPFVGERQDVDFGGEGALLGIDDVGVGEVVHPEHVGVFLRHGDRSPAPAG